MEISTTAPSLATQLPSSRPIRFVWPIAGGAATLSLISLLMFPPKRRQWSAALGLGIFAILATACIGCGGGAVASSGGNGGGATGAAGTPTGVTYTATVTGTCGPLSHSASFTFTVQ